MFIVVIDAFFWVRLRKEFNCTFVNSYNVLINLGTFYIGLLVGLEVGGAGPSEVYVGGNGSCAS